MISRNEKLRSVERFSAEEEHIENTHRRLDTQDVERLLMRQAEMLLAIEHDVSPAVFDALYAKIEYENRFLLDIIVSDTEATRAKKRLNRTLKADYFIQKHFDANLI
ncbi:MAG: hypothetical protein KGH79_02825 [Patescibacteria group bacterium]|nr:hypothetical protein [Patescibacteria group bacterium]